MKKIIATIKTMKTNNVFKNYIDYIRFPKFRNLEDNTKISFDFPLTFFVGKNGIGMPSELHSVGHFNYSSAIKVKLNELNQTIGVDDLEGAYNLLENFTDALKTKIAQNPTWNSGQFVDFIIEYLPNP